MADLLPPDPDDEGSPLSVIPPPPASITSPPPSPTFPDPEAMVVALVLSPTAYPRNQFFALFNIAPLRKARWRAAQLRGLVNALARPKAPIVDYTIRPHENGKVLSYRVPSVNLRVRAFLQPHEAAVVELAVAKIRGEEPPADSLAMVNRWLERLAPSNDVPPSENSPPPARSGSRP
ncbi:MAG: hypothetical protein RMJ98_00790 [Myxococcales bacterium]|nr:hypothetical protein [Polyangiaceae bacterium]MDW8247822.1 hypothetical protein [Myxococcales bacterium]